MKKKNELGDGVNFQNEVFFLKEKWKFFFFLKKNKTSFWKFTPAPSLFFIISFFIYFFFFWLFVISK